MIDTPLDRLAVAYGLQLSYRSEEGENRSASDDDKRAILSVMGVPVSDDAAIARSLDSAPAPIDGAIALPNDLCCYLPDYLAEGGRAWGVTCQLYGLRSARNHGIGDFEDLARLAERMAADGADFVGVNPVHALFTAAPERCSPFSPSNRRFLNPLYIALDRIPGISGAVLLDDDETVCARLRSADRVDYGAVAALKLGALRRLWRQITDGVLDFESEARENFESFIERGGESLLAHALFEAVSHNMAARGRSAGWHGWPATYQDADGEAARRFARENAAEVRFHLWLQWIADAQLGAAAGRARAAGMRIGLYLDFAVGTAPDGSATWTDSSLVVPGANVGAPPDAFFSKGQDWGLAPFAPAVLRARRFAPYRREVESSIRHAGALRMDHAMGLHRLFWIPHGRTPDEGCYVLYPMKDLMRVLADLSHEHGTIIIGEDLGTVPKGFSETMRDAGVLSCRVLYFERTRRGFRASASYAKNAFLSASTHDLPPLAGWWQGSDIALMRTIGLVDAAGADRWRDERAADRRALVDRLRREDSRRTLPAPISPDEAAAAGSLTRDLAVNVHAFLARTPSRLLGLQVEDLCGAEAPVNLPGTNQEYPNWRGRSAVAIEDAGAPELWSSIIEAVARERPKPR